MALFRLINTTRIGTTVYPAGTLLNDAQDDTVGITAAGGVYAPSPDTNLDAAGALAIAAHAAGNSELGEKIMLAYASVALTSWLASRTHAQGASLIGLEDTGGFFATKNVEAALAALGGAQLGLQKCSVTITQAADLAGLGAGTKTLSKNWGAVLPANSRFAGFSVGEATFTGFKDAGDTLTFSLTGGDSGAATNLFTAANVRTGQAGFPKTATPGAKAAFFGYPLAAGQATVVLTCSGDLNTASAGAVTIDLWYFVMAP
jgi:hypothetical protein